MNLKENFACRICKKIQKHPIYLPCLCASVCQHHINDLLKSNIKEVIECFECHDIFDVRNYAFKTNKQLEKLIEMEFYLTEDERHQKQDLNKNSENLFNCYANFKNEYEKFEVTRFDHFQDVRRKIDLRCEDLIRQIQEESNQLIEELKVIEHSYTQTVKETFQSQKVTYNIEKEIENVAEIFQSINLDPSQIKEKANEQAKKLSVLNDEFIKLESFKNDLTKNEFNQNDIFKFGASQFGRLDTKDIRKQREHLSMNLNKGIF